MYNKLPIIVKCTLLLVSNSYRQSVTVRNPSTVFAIEVTFVLGEC